MPKPVESNTSGDLSFKLWARFQLTVKTVTNTARNLVTLKTEEMDSAGTILLLLLLFSILLNFFCEPKRAQIVCFKNHQYLEHLLPLFFCLPLNRTQQTQNLIWAVSPFPFLCLVSCRFIPFSVENNHQQRLLAGRHWTWSEAFLWDSCFHKPAPPESRSG